MPSTARPPSNPTTGRLLRPLRTTADCGIALLVLAVAAIAFYVSFESISLFAIQLGALPPHLGWCAPLLVDTFTAAATLERLSRNLWGEADSAYARLLIGLAIGVSVTLNVAHAPHTPAAQGVAALAPIAFLAAVEFLMSVARRRLAHATPTDPTQAAGPATAGAALGLLPEPSGRSTIAVDCTVTSVEPQPAAVTAAAEQLPPRRVDSRSEVALLLRQEQQLGVRLTGKQIAARVGISESRALQLARELRLHQANNQTQ